MHFLVTLLSDFNYRVIEEEEEGTKTSAEISLVCDLKFRVGCQDSRCVNSDADETLA